MANQSFLYNSTTGGPTKQTIFNVLKPNLIRAAGLEECVSIYMMVGDCADCKPEDVLWTEIFECGKPVQLCPDNTTVLLSIPGKYSLGDPNQPALTLAGDVNITRENGVDASLVGKSNCTSESSEVQLSIETSCTDPLFVEICNQTPVETAMAELGCIADGDGLIIGKVMICKIVDETTGVEIVTQTAYYQDGTVETNYSGAWQVCAPNRCEPEVFMGVITDLSMLNN